MLLSSYCPKSNPLAKHQAANLAIGAKPKAPLESSGNATVDRSFLTAHGQLTK
jgi:hypothetical protein